MATEENTEEIALDPAKKSGWRNWLSHPNSPYIACAILIAGALATAAYQLKPNIFRVGAPDIVVFDPVKFMNAQRAAAASLTHSANADLSLAITQVATQAERVILEEAKGSIILVKQAVILPNQYPDITDNVLNRFGLNTDVPTITVKPTLSTYDLAPSDMAFTARQLAEDYRQELKQDSKALRDAVEKTGNQIDTLP